MRKIKATMILLAAALVVVPFASSQAVSGKNISDTRIVVKAKQGGKWFKSLEEKTGKNGVLKVKNVLPGQYKFELKNKKDAKDGQFLALKLRVLDEKGRKFTKKTAVEVSTNVSGKDVLIAKVTTNKKGEFELENVPLDMEYKIKVADSSKVKKKSDKARIKTKAKIEKSKWFPNRYQRTDRSYTYKVSDVLPGKYKFKYKSGDRNDNQPFTLNARLLDKNGKQIKKATNVTVYGYLGKGKVKTKLATLKTDKKGWVTIPNVMPGMQYRIDVK
ncbi:MAG TPA: hypothetical protein GX706_03725 [Candidatus Moranbacteria bacterium]|nr:hypothetical protein [Candidatus Moranbacteria bacterium]